MRSVVAAFDHAHPPVEILIAFQQGQDLLVGAIHPIFDPPQHAAQGGELCRVVALTLKHTLQLRGDKLQRYLGHYPPPAAAYTKNFSPMRDGRIAA